MEAILASMVEGVLVVDGQGRLQLVNDAARRMLKLEREADRPPLRRGHPSSRHRRTDRPRAMAGGPTEGLELSLTRGHATARSSRASPRWSPTGRGAVLVLHDITDLKKADQIRRDFVANVSHELRTPLTAIKGYAEALLDDPDDDEARRAIPGHHSSARDANGAAGQGSAAAGTARRRPGDRGLAPVRHRGDGSQEWSTTSSSRSRRSSMTVRLAIPDEARIADHRCRQASRHPAEPDRERGELHAGRR